MDLLSPFGWLYGRAANVRNALYDRGVFASHPLGARSISIGNITVGGTGKTPLVALTTQILAERGGKVCILTADTAESSLPAAFSYRTAKPFSPTPKPAATSRSN